MQNYDPKTGEYEPDLKGPNGEKPSSFGNFKKGDEKKSQHDKINAKRMGKNALGYGEEEVNQLKDDALKFLKGSLTEEELDAVKDNEQLLNDYASGKYSVGDVKLVAKNKLEGADNQDVESSEEDKSFKATNEKRMNGKENLKNKIEEWKKNNPDGKVEENVDIESLKEKRNEALALIDQIRKNTSYEDLGKKGLSMTDDEKSTYQEYKNKIDVLTEVAKADNIEEKANQKLSNIMNNLRHAKDIKQRMENGEASEEDERYYNELLDKKQILTTLLENLNEDLGSQKGKSSKFKELNNKRMGNDKLPF